METKEIITEIKHLPLQQRLLVLEEIYKSIRLEEKDKNLDTAINELMKDYKENHDLTDLTALDYEEFYETK